MISENKTTNKQNGKIIQFDSISKKKKIEQSDELKIEEEVQINKIQKNNNYLFNIDKETYYSLISHMKKVKNIQCKNRVNNTPKYEYYQFVDNNGSKITFNMYYTGKFGIQGKPSRLYDEAISFLTRCNEVTLDNLVSTYNNIQKLNLNLNDIRDEIKRLLPNSYYHLDEYIIKILSPSIALSKIDIELEDYSCIAFPALRALEGYLLYLLDKIRVPIRDKKTVGIVFYNKKEENKFYLTKEVVKKTSNKIIIECIEDIYNYFHSNRHVIFHANQILIETKIIENKEEAEQIITYIFNIIEKTYNSISNECIYSNQ